MMYDVASHAGTEYSGLWPEMGQCLLLLTGLNLWIPRNAVHLSIPCKYQLPDEYLNCGIRFGVLL